MRAADTRHRFLIETCDVRGILVRLDDTWLQAVQRGDYPPRVRELLGQAFVAAGLMASSIKFDGRLTLQVRGSGNIHLLVVQVSSAGELRGVARWSEEPASLALPDAFGSEARMMVALERDGKEPWQGIVPLAGHTLAEALSGWFRTSEQLDTELFLQCRDGAAEGLMLQRLPEAERVGGDADGWQRACQLALSLTSRELAELDASSLLRRLYHQEDVRLFEPESLVFHCRCSAERTDNMLVGLGEAEVRDILAEVGQVEITCEFCNAEYRYDAVDIEALFHGGDTHPTGDTDEDPDTRTLH